MVKTQPSSEKLIDVAKNVATLINKRTARRVDYEEGFSAALVVVMELSNARKVDGDLGFFFRKAYEGTLRHLQQCRVLDRPGAVTFERLSSYDENRLVAPEEVSLDSDDWLTLERSMKTLRPMARYMVWLHHGHGHSYEEISEITGEPEGEVIRSVQQSIREIRQRCGV